MTEAEAIALLRACSTRIDRITRPGSATSWSSRLSADRRSPGVVHHFHGKPALKTPGLPIPRAFPLRVISVSDAGWG